MVDSLDRDREDLSLARGDAHDGVAAICGGFSRNEHGVGRDAVAVQRSARVRVEGLR